MTQILRQSTQIKVVIGPVVAVGDGFTPVTTLSLASADEAEIIKSDSGTVTDISAATFAAITSADGYYNLTLTTSHTDTVGLMTVLINDDSLCLPVKATFQVIEEAVYDALYAASALGYVANAPVNVAQISGDSTAADNLEAILDGTGGVTLVASAFTLTTPITANVTQLSGDSTAADNAESFFDGTGYAGTNNVIPTVTTATNVTTVNGLAAGVITATSIAADAITAAKIANGAIDAATFAADVDAEILSYLVDDATRIDASALNTASVTTVPAINTKLGTPSDLGNGATIAFNLSDIHTDTAAIDAIAAKLSGLVMASEVIGSTGNSTTTVHLSTLTYGDDEINDQMLVVYDNSTGEFHARWVTDWVNSTKLATVATLPFTPENAVDTYYLTSLRRDMTAATVSDKTGYSVSGTTTTLDALQTALNSAHGAGSWATATGFSTHSAADVWAAGTRTLTAATNISGPIADQVWEEAVADHSGTAGSTAEALNAAGSAGDPWNTALPGAYTSGKAGYIVGTFLDAAISSRSTVTTAQVNTEVDTALADIHLDHLIASADPGSVVANSSFLAKLVSKSATPAFSSYDNTTDSLEALRDRGDSAWITATGFSTHSAADVWAAGTRTLTAGTNIQLPSNGLANVTAWTVAITGNITGNLSGSVGSVSGAVGSVTGNVGGNVTGSVGSVLGGINTTAGVITTLDGLDTAQDSQHSTTQGLVTTVATVVDSILVDTTQIKADLPTRPTKNVALANFPFVMRLTSDHVTGATGKTVTATRRIDNGSFASCANSASEVSNGVYTINLAAADLNGDTILLRFAAADCDDTFILVVTQP